MEKIIYYYISFNFSKQTQLLLLSGEFSSHYDRFGGHLLFDGWEEWSGNKD